MPINWEERIVTYQQAYELIDKLNELMGEWEGVSDAIESLTEVIEGCERGCGHNLGRYKKHKYLEGIIFKYCGHCGHDMGAVTGEEHDILAKYEAKEFWEAPHREVKAMPEPHKQQEFQK